MECDEELDSIYDLWVSIEEQSFCRIPHTEPSLKSEHNSIKLLSNILLSQGESLIIITSSCKSIPTKHLCNAEIYCSSLITVESIKDTISRAKVIFVDDLHMANTNIIEFFRFVNKYKGYYDTYSCKYKSIKESAFLYTTSNGECEDVKRLLSNVVKVYLNDVVDQSVFVEHWVSLNDELKEKCVSVIKNVTKHMKVSETLLYNMCRVLKNNKQYTESVLYSELLLMLYDRAKDGRIIDIIKKEIQKEFKAFTADDNHVVGDYIDNVQRPISVDQLKSMIRVNLLTEDIPYIHFDVKY